MIQPVKFLGRFNWRKKRWRRTSRGTRNMPYLKNQTEETDEWVARDEDTPKREWILLLLKSREIEKNRKDFFPFISLVNTPTHLKHMTSYARTHTPIRSLSLGEDATGSAWMERITAHEVVPRQKRVEDVVAVEIEAILEPRSRLKVTQVRTPCSTHLGTVAWNREDNKGTSVENTRLLP